MQWHHNSTESIIGSQLKARRRNSRPLYATDEGTSYFVGNHFRGMMLSAVSVFTSGFWKSCFPVYRQGVNQRQVLTSD